MSEGRLLGIARRDRKRGPMELLDHALVSDEAGVQGDFRGRPGKRQVTVLSAECWEAACADLGRRLPWTTRRANLLIEGIALAHTTGRHLRIGDLLLEITGELDPCSRMDEASAGLCDALTADWRGGVTCRVLSGAAIDVGSGVHLETDDG